MVVITGASSGIGRELARLYASRGRSLLLVARRQDRLDALAAELTGVDIETLSLDLGEPTAVAALMARLDGRPVDIFINNAGLGCCSPIVDMDPQRIDEMVALNVRVLTHLCREIGGQMARGDGGAIVNVASVAGFVPGPYQAVYYACKAYVVSLSASLRHELAPAGVRVSCLCPGPTSTEFHQHAGVRSKGLAQRFFMESPSEVARAAVAGVERNQAVIFPGWRHRVLGAFSRLLPGSVTARVSSGVAKRQKG